jgi:glucokinase
MQGGSAKILSGSTSTAQNGGRMTELVVADIGGTHARFAIAEVDQGRVIAISPPVILKTAEHESLQHAWGAFRREAGGRLPQQAAIAVATPVGGEVLKLTNNPWIMRPASFRDTLELDGYILINDFGAVAHAVDRLAPPDFRHLCGPSRRIPRDGTITIIGPGTGLGVAQLARKGGRSIVIETEAGHMDFAPVDDLDDAILQFLRTRHGRVSIERLVSGPGLANICEALAFLDGDGHVALDDRALWAAALEESDDRAVLGLERLCLTLGSAAGDIALAHGAAAVVIAGGLGLRLAEHLPRSGFHQRFVAKGRFQHLMNTLPVWLVVHPEPGLFGAAAAFAAERFEAGS